MGDVTDLTPVAFDPETGLNTYEIMGPSGKVEKKSLFSVENYFKTQKAQPAMNQMMYVNRRIQKLGFIYGIEKMDPIFALDLAASSLPDDEMYRMVKYRLALADRNPKWWTRVWNNPATRGVMHGFDWAYDHSMNALARAATNRDDVTFHGLFAIGATVAVGTAMGKSQDELQKRLNYDREKKEFLDRETGEPIPFNVWMSQQDKAFQGMAFVGSFIDPLLLMGWAKAARGAAGVIRELPKGASAIRKLFTTTVEDASRIMQGKLEWSDWFKGVKVTDFMRSALGVDTRAQRLIAALDRSGSALETKKLLQNFGRGEAPQDVVEYLFDARKFQRVGGRLRKVGDGVENAIVDLWDVTKHDKIAAHMEEAAGRGRAVEDELNSLPKWAKRSLREIKATPEAEQFGKIREMVEAGLIRDEDMFFQAMQWDDEVSSIKTALHDLGHEQSTINYLRKVPEASLGMEASAVMHKLGGALDASSAYRQIKRAIEPMGQSINRSLRAVFSMVPHRTVDITTDMAHNQFSRWLNEVELITGKRRIRGAVEGAWTKAESEEFYGRFVAAKTDLDRLQVVKDAHNHFLGNKLGFTERQIRQVVKEVDKYWGKQTAYVNRAGQKVKFALSPDDLHYQTQFLSATEMRRLARVGTKTFTSEAEKMRAIGFAFEKLNTLWKTTAIFRPAWVMRVVLLSEQPRLAMAGLPNLITHPLLAAALSPLPGVNKVASKLLGARTKLPVVKNLFRTGVTSVVEDLDTLIKEWHNAGGVWATAARKRAESGVGGLKVDVNPFQGPHRSSWKHADLEHETDLLFYDEGWLRGLNETLAKDPLANLWRQGWTEKEVKNWARTNPEGVRLRQQLDVADDNIDLWISQNRDRYENWTAGFSDDQLANLGNLELDDLEGLSRPKELPARLWADTLRAPGMTMPKAVVDRLWGQAWKSLSATPSYYLSRHGPIQYETVSEVQRLVDLHHEAAIKAKKGGVRHPVLKDPDYADTVQLMHRSEIERYAAPGGVDDPTDIPVKARSIRRSGWKEPLTLRVDPKRRTALLEDGHHRLAAAAKLDLSEVPVTVRFGDLRGERHAVRIPGAKKVRITEENMLRAHAPNTIFSHAVVEKPSSVIEAVDKQKIIKNLVRPQNLSPAERAIFEESYRNATTKVRQVVYDLAESARVADLARFVIPFGNAYQEEITRWAQLFWMRPHIPIAFMNMWRNKSLLPFSYKDPRSGEDYYFIPGSAWLTKFATGSGWNPFTKARDGLAWPISARWKSLNIVTGNGLFPGGGPWLQVGARAVDKIAHVPPGIMNMIDPYAGRRKISDILFASPIYRATRQAFEEGTRDKAAMLNAAIAQEWYETGGDPDKIDVDKIEKQVRAMSVISAAANLTVGGGAKAVLPPKIQEMAAYMKWAQTNFPEAAERLFLEVYGDDVAAFMTHYTKNLTGEPATREAEDMLLNPDMQQAARRYGRAFWALQSESARGEYDPVAFAAQVERGDREYREGDEFLTAAVTFTAWWKYGHLKQQFQAFVTANDLRPGSDRYDAIRQVFENKRQALFDAYPDFFEEWKKSSREEWQVEQKHLYDMIDQDFAQELQGTRASREYFEAMRMVKTAMEERGIASLASQEAKPLAMFWSNYLASLFKRFPDFQNVYYRLNLDNMTFRDDEMPWGTEIPKG